MVLLGGSDFGTRCSNLLRGALLLYDFDWRMAGAVLLIGAIFAIFAFPTMSGPQAPS
jgi:hypothetical protein